LIEALTRLAAPASEQIAYVNLGRGLPVHIDELALELDDVYVLVPQLVGARWLTARQEALITVVSLRLGAMSGEHNGELWTERALRECAEWKMVRALAIQALAELTTDSEGRAPQ
jgi:hypothetical protein